MADWYDDSLNAKNVKKTSEVEHTWDIVLRPGSVWILRTFLYYPIRNGYHVYLLLLSSKYSQFLCSVDFKHVPMCFASLTSLRKWSRENRSVPLYVFLVPSCLLWCENTRFKLHKRPSNKRSLVQTRLHHYKKILGKLRKEAPRE